MKVSEIDLSDVYPRYAQELAAFHDLARAVSREIYWEHLREPLAAKPLPELRPSLPLFGNRMVDFLIDVGDLVIHPAGHLQPEWQPGAQPGVQELISAYAAAEPRRASLAYFLTACRAVAGGVLAGSDGLRLMRARDPHGIMGCWEDVMLNAPILEPCRILAARALASRMTASLVVFEGGAGVGVVLRTLLQEWKRDPQKAAAAQHLTAYHYTELDPALLALGKTRLAQVAPPALACALQYRPLDLDAFARTPSIAGLAPGSVDCIVLEHVLYDVADLHATLLALRSLLRPGGALIFTGAFRGRPATFFPCEMLQVTLASYRRARLDPPYRSNIGYLSLAEWELSLSRAGFAPQVLPAPDQQEHMPHGGIIAVPC